jgi:aminoglycoside phosphotransferase (APT) family kinase protein
LPWLDGDPGDVEPVTESHRSAMLLGRFLRALHVPAPADAPENLYRGIPLSQRADIFAERIHEFANFVDAEGSRRVWNRAVTTPAWDGPAVWLHGDLHPANTVISNGALSAVIDFGDLCSGDPAMDVAAMWMLLPTSVFSTFAQAYGGVDTGLERRSLGWAVLLALMLLAIGLDGRPTYDRVARTTLARSVERSDRMN